MELILQSKRLKTYLIVTGCYELLKGLYVKPTNEIYSRHLSATRKQEENESLYQYLQTRV